MATSGDRRNSDEAPREHPRKTGSPWRWLRRPAVWVGGVLTAVLVGVLTPLVQGSLTEPADGPSTSTTTSTTPITGPPAKVAALQLERDESNSYAFPQRLDLTEADLRTVSHAHQSQTDPGLYDQWARERGGADDYKINIKLVLEGNRRDPIRILGLRPIKDCREPLTGTLLYSPSAGADENIKIGLNLDEPSPIARNWQEYEIQGDYFAENTVSLEYKEQQTFQIIAQTLEQYCEFTLEFTILDEGETVTQEVANGSEPFRVSALVDDWDEPAPFDLYQALYIGGVANPDSSGEFIPADPSTFRG